MREAVLRAPLIGDVYKRYHSRGPSPIFLFSETGVRPLFSRKPGSVPYFHAALQPGGGQRPRPRLSNGRAPARCDVSRRRASQCRSFSSSRHVLALSVAKAASDRFYGPCELIDEGVDLL